MLVKVQGGELKLRQVWPAAAGKQCGDAWASVESVQTPHYSHPMQAHDGVVWAAALNRDGDLLATGGQDAVVRVWRLLKGHRLECGVAR